MAPLMAMWSKSLRCTLSKCWQQRTISFNQARCLSKTQRRDGEQASSARDPEPLFLDPAVQTILYRVTGFDMDRIFRVRPVADIKAPAYKLMTDNQLQKAHEEAIRHGRQRLQMAPFMKARDEKSSELISDDSDIAGHDIVKYVFTDITFGVSERDRLMVVREPTGVLRTTSWEERDRLQKVYFPTEGRMHRTPRMFEQENLEKLLERGQFEYILDRACVQFEPDDPEFIRVSHRTYAALDAARSYNYLYSTRHFGGMTFYLVFYGQIDGLLAHKIQQEMITDAGDMVQLYNIVHPNSATAKVTKEDKVMDNLQLIKAFIANDAAQSSELELCLQTYMNAHSKKAMAS